MFLDYSNFSSLLILTFMVFLCLVCALVICGQSDLSGSCRCPSYICFFDLTWGPPQGLGPLPAHSAMLLVFQSQRFILPSWRTLFDNPSFWIHACLDNFGSGMAVRMYLSSYIKCYIKYMNPP